MTSKKRKHPKGDAPVEDINDQASFNVNDNNAISSGSANTKNTLSSGSSHQTSSLNNDEQKNNEYNHERLKPQARTNRAKTFQDRKTMPKNVAGMLYPQNNLAAKSFYIRPQPKEEEIKEKDVLSTFRNSFSERITINLPLDELNASSLRADVLLSMAKDKAELLDKSVTETEKKMEDISSQMKTIINKSRSITQTATVINAKLVNIDDWIDRIGSDKSDIKISIVEFFVALFSILTTILSLMWFSFRRQPAKTKKS